MHDGSELAGLKKQNSNLRLLLETEREMRIRAERILRQRLLNELDGPNGLDFARQLTKLLLEGIAGGP